MTPEELRAVLEAAGRQDPPAPRAEFTSDLEARLATTHVVTASRAPRPRWQAAALVAAAAAVVAAELVLQPSEPEQTIVTDTTTTFTVERTTTTTAVTVTAPTTTTPTTAVVQTTVASVPVTTTSAAPPATPTTVPPTTIVAPTTTSTTAAPSVEPLRMSCTAGPRPEVTCTWSASTSDAFQKYILSKRVADGELQELGRSSTRDETTKTDRDVEAGTRITYVIEAYDSDGFLIGRGEAAVACC